MELIISESQYRSLLTEATKNKISKNISKLDNITKEVVDKVNYDYKLNFKLLVTWSASIGGMIGPIGDFIQGKYPEISDKELALILVGCISTFFYENKDRLKEIIKIIKEFGLTDIFYDAISVGNKLKTTFLLLMESLGITAVSMLNIMSYAFIIPLLDDFWELAHSTDINENIIKTMVERVITSGTLTLSAFTLSKIFRGLLNKLKNEPDKTQ
jgi:hypothetical protein